MNSTALPQCSTGMRGSGPTVPLACLTPWAIRSVNGVTALPMSIWPQAMSYFLPSSESVLVRPVTPCLVAV